MVAEMDAREFGVSRRFVQFRHSGWCSILILVQVWRGDLLGIDLLEQAVRINWASACRLGQAVGGGWMGCDLGW